MTWLGHATFRFTTPEGRIVLIDPWTYSNPACPEELKVAGRVDVILVTHGHNDHRADLARIAEASAPTVVAVPELAKWLASRGVKNTFGMNHGGVIRLHDVGITMTPASHSSSVDEDPFAYVGVAAGYVIEFSNGRRIYHAGDTAAFDGMRVVRDVHRPDVALLPIGDHHTMGPEEAAFAATLLGVRQVVPMHYGLPGTSGTPDALRAALDGAGRRDLEVVEMKPGETIG